MRMLTLIGLAALLPALTGARPLALDDYYRWQTVSDPRVSADGRSVAYALSTPDRDADADVTSIWLIGRDGGNSRRLTPAKSNEQNPRWSPDGRYLAFLSDRGKPNADPQIWVVDPSSGDAVQRSRFKGSISEFGWSPDAKQMVFAGVESTVDDSASGGKPLPIVINRLQFKRDFVGYLGNARSHLYLLDLGSGAISQLTHGPADEIQPAWSPDGASIVFLTKADAEPDAHDNWDIFLIDARRGGTPRQLTQTPEMENDPEWGRSYGPPRFSPDGRRLAYVRGGDPKDLWFGLVQLALSGIDGAAAQLPTQSLDRLTLDPKWSADGRWVYFLLEDDRSQRLARIRLRDGHIEQLTGDESVVSEFDVSRDGGIVAVYGKSNQPSELVAIEHGKIRSLTHHNEGWVREVSLVAAKNIEFASADGTSVHGLLLLPAGEKPAQGWPALVRVDGGPVAQWQQEFDFEWQYFVQQGYAVVAANPRGSSGRGFAFQRAILANWGFVDGPDILAAADFAVRAGFADPRRLGIGGWSYGSQLTNFVIATDSRFKAATSGAGISNMLAGYGIDQYVREWETELGLPWQKTDLWLKMSYAFLHADRIATPTLFMCGSEDANVPATGAQQMYQALRRLGVPTELVIYPGEYHSFARPGFRVDVIRRYIEWYDRYLKAN